MSLNLACLVREPAKTSPDKNVLVWEGGQMSYAQLDALSDQLARGLRAAGFSPGDRIGLQLPNIPQFVIAYFAILKNGCIAVPMNVLLRAPEIAFQLSHSGASALFTWAGVADEAARAVADSGVPNLYVVNTPGTPEATVGTRFEALMGADPSTPAPFEQTDPGDTAVIIYTSGTTGTPKGAELTHFQLLMNADTPGRVFDYQADDVALVILPLFHIFALSSQLHVALRFGGTLSLLPRFDPVKAIEAIKRDRVTVFVGVPTMYIALLQMEVDPADVESLRVGISGGAPIPAEVIDAFEERFGITILEGYGLTESASTTTFNISESERRIYSVGKPIWGVDVEVWGDADEPLPRGSDHIGEIVIRGFNIMKGYYNAPEANEATFTRGWFRSGDLGYFDEDGFLFIVDRKKDMIIRGGYNVYPRELEEVLFQHPAVAEAAVIGVPDDRLGEEVKAFVVLKSGEDAREDDIIDFMKERVAAYKYPRSIEFRDELEHGPSGKVLKARLR